MRFTIDCPHCAGRVVARSSRYMTATMREITFVCADPECGHTFVAELVAVRTLSPSAKPNEAVNLPLSPHVKERVMKQLQLLD